MKSVIVFFFPRIFGLTIDAEVEDLNIAMFLAFFKTYDLRVHLCLSL